MNVTKQNKIELSGFNNLTKCLSFNLYDFCISRNEKEVLEYQKYIQEAFSAKKVSKTLEGICGIIEANVLTISDQDYEPWGASSLVLMSDLKGGGGSNPLSSAHAHLDKSHICAHTYPDIEPKNGICSIRLDIDIATCGEISPLNALNFMLESYTSDVVVMDYVVRGFTRDKEGKRIYLDHEMKSIKDFIKPSILDEYRSVDLALQSDKIWQTKMIRTKITPQEYFLTKVSQEEIDLHLPSVQKEMEAVVHMWPS